MACKEGLMFIPVSVRKLNTLISHRNFIKIISVSNEIVELDFGDKIATIGFMGDVFWSDKE